jgi:hypothetical protein
MTILDRYFELSDLIMESDKYFDELINLFDQNAIMKPARDEKIIGIDSIRKFFKDFFSRNSVLKHVWYTERLENSPFIKTIWIACGRRKSGNIFIVKGYDIAEVNSKEKIISLEVIIESAM